ncbi:DNA repair protein complementing XP-C cells homolog [Saccostrea cucullata]|uniref:DNA repair protein complementing XP-C cells homolog n=1 Tax=Saccostrea cuccullata TaxID=36930 RepID=UPI002ED4273D
MPSRKRTHQETDNAVAKSTTVRRRDQRKLKANAESKIGAGGNRISHVEMTSTVKSDNRPRNMDYDFNSIKMSNGCDQLVARKSRKRAAVDHSEESDKGAGKSRKKTPNTLDGKPSRTKSKRLRGHASQIGSTTLHDDGTKNGNKTSGRKQKQVSGDGGDETETRTRNVQSVNNLSDSCRQKSKRSAGRGKTKGSTMVKSEVKDEDVPIKLKTEAPENLDIKLESRLCSENVEKTCGEENDEVGVMSSSDSDDEFEPVTKKLKSSSEEEVHETNEDVDKKSLLNSVSKSKAPIKAGGRRKREAKVGDKKQLNSKGQETKKETKDKKDVKKNSKTNVNKNSSSKRKNSGKLVEKSTHESHNSSDISCPPESVHSKGPSDKPKKPIDHSDVMSVLLHMEGVGEKAGPSGMCVGGQDSDGGSEGDSEEESDWEEVKDVEGSPLKSQIPKEPVEVILEAPNFLKKRKKKEFDWKAYVQRQINRFNKELREDIHKVHLMCLLSTGRYLNQVCNNLVLRGVALSLLPHEFSSLPSEKYEVSTHTRFVNWYKGTISIDPSIGDNEKSNLPETLVRRMENKTVASRQEFVLFYLVMLRCIGINARLVTSLQPLPLKNTKQEDDVKKIKIKGNPAAIQKPIKENSKKNPTEKSKAESKVKEKESKTKSEKKSKDKKKQSAAGKSKGQSSVSKTQKIKNKSLRERDSKVRPNSYHDNSDIDDSGDDFEPEKDKEHQGKKSRSSDSMSSSDKSLERLDRDSDFEEETKTFRSPVRKSSSGKKKNKKVLSSDSDGEDQVSKQGCDEWVEVYVEPENSWMCIDCLRGHINRPYRIESAATQPVHYVMAYNEDGTWKDVTARYASNWMTETRKLRVDPEWWDETLSVYKCEEDRAEDEEIKANLMKRPLPTNISAYKSHPLYALRRHLLKFEAIYPESSAPLGYIRGEPVYARECVHQLHSRETWLKEGRAVRIGEEAYKMVKSRPKWNKPKLDPDALDLEVFGLWQTEVYIPPPAVDGKVPRNAYGNVEMFKPTMLPAGTVHLKIPGLNKVAKKLNIDCVPAMVGWDSHCGFSHPVLDGFIVCEEHKDVLLAAWDEEQEIQKEKEAEKKEKRVIGNWKLLIKGLLIKERIKKRFNLVDKEEEEKTQSKSKGKKATDAEKSWPRKNPKSGKLSHTQETL